MFEGANVAIVTPFKDGRVDLPSVAQFAVGGGSTGA